MATVGLRLGMRFCPAIAGGRGSLIRASVSQPTTVTSQRLAWKAPALGSCFARREHNTTASNNDHFYMTEFGLFSDFYRAPVSKWPSIFSKEGLKYAKTCLVEGYRGMWSFVMIKFKLSGWSKKKFAKEAESLSNLMNEAYACGDLQTLETICMPMLYSKMRTDVKRRRTDFAWHAVRSVQATRIVKIRCGKLTPKVSVGQVTVRVDQIQRVEPMSRKGGASRHAASSRSVAPRDTHVLEYIVFQRELSNDSSPWVIYKKIDVPAWDLPSKPKDDKL
ncbi:hypothetical protein LPJ59_005093 [Coemansia sp. RSA 2399]|nr:hypothetical protein LPJ59_005093 [Coemansia sp. RSA 2399]KAJ1895661.1 hypothetical protein LPJ81_004913 [Coemansia sp. IMI 209127]